MHRVAEPEPETPVASVQEPAVVSPRREYDENRKPEYVRPIPCPQCDAKKAELEKGVAELTEIDAKHDEWVKKNCKGNLKSVTRVFPGGARSNSAPERAWVCDGKMVDSTESYQQAAVAARNGRLRGWIKDNCDVDPTDTVRVGEKRCREY